MSRGLVKSVLVLQHSGPEHLGLVADALDGERVGFEYVRLDQAELPPANLSGYGGLVVLGGPQSVYEEDLYPYLTREKQLVHEAVASGVPILGICLGSQLLARALGAAVVPGAVFEVGWKPVWRSPEATRDPVFAALPEEFVPLHWHGDVYEMPPGAIPLGHSTLTPVQGFSWGGRSYGLMFHLEMTQPQVEAMCNLFPEELDKGAENADGVISVAPARLGDLLAPASALFGSWAKLVRSLAEEPTDRQGSSSLAADG